MTEEFKAMCQTVAEMAKEELDVGQGGCFLMFAHEAGSATDETLKAAFGKGDDLCTAICMSMLSVTERMPKMVRAAFIVSTMRTALHHCMEAQEEEHKDEAD